jgi:hypothetical protein
MLADGGSCGLAVALKTAAEQTAMGRGLMLRVLMLFGVVDVDGGKDYCGLC